MNQTKKYDLKKSKAIITLFTSAALSTALISFFTTQQGLQSYIFERNVVSACVLSGAVQGSLFALSTEGNNIQGKLTEKTKKLFFAIWFLLLCFSSGFSYVSICSTAYPASILHEDAEQVLAEYCLTTDYELFDYIRTVEDEYLHSIQVYLNQVNGVSSSGDGFAIAVDDDETFSEEIQKLELYMNDSNTDDYSEIKDVLNSGLLISSINRLKSGNYSTNDYEAYAGGENAKGHLPTKIDEAERKRENYNQKYQEQVAEIERLDKRLKDFHNLQEQAYKDTRKEREQAIKLRDKYKKLYDKLDDYCSDLSVFQSFVSVDFKKGTESALHEKTKELTKLSQSEEIDTQKVLTLAEEVYSLLVDNNTSQNEPSMENYPVFKSSIRGYKTILDQKAIINTEIDKINSYRAQLLLQNSTTSEDDKSTTNSDSNSNEWKNVWNTHLNEIERVLENLQDTANESTSDDTASVQLPKSKKEYIREISRRRRLYLEDISVFERNWTLLIESIPVIGFHPYGLMMWVSLIIAFGLDMFSTGMGYLLYNYIENVKEGIS